MLCFLSGLVRPVEAAVRTGLAKLKVQPGSAKIHTICQIASCSNQIQLCLIAGMSKRIVVEDKRRWGYRNANGSWNVSATGGRKRAIVLKSGYCIVNHMKDHHDRTSR